MRRKRGSASFFALLLIVLISSCSKKGEFIAPIIEKTTLDVAGIIQTEGRAYACALTGTASFTGTSVSLGGPLLPMGRALALSSITLSASKHITWGTYIGAVTSNGFPLMEYGSGVYMTGANANVTIPQSGIVRFGGQPINITVKKVTDPANPDATTINFDYACSANGTLITDDLNFGADYIIDFIGDSILGGVGAANMNNMVAFQVRNYFLSKGYNVRLRNWSVSGATALAQEVAEKAGRMNVTAPDALFIGLGTNDVNTGIAADATAQSIARQCAYYGKLYSSAKIIVLAIPPRNDRHLDAQNTITSTAINASLKQLKMANVSYVPQLRTAWRWDDSSNYVADNLHPNEAGNNAYFTTLKTWLDKNMPTLN